MPSVWSLASLLRLKPQAEKLNRMIHINRSCDDLLNKLEAVRLLCRETGCATLFKSTLLMPYIRKHSGLTHLMAQIITRDL